MEKETISDSWKQDFSFAQFKKDMSFLQVILKPYFWVLLFMASAPILVECALIIYLVVKFSLEGRGFLAFGMGGCAILFLVFSLIFIRGGFLLPFKKKAKKRSVRSLIWGFSVMFVCGLVSCFMY